MRAPDPPRPRAEGLLVEGALALGLRLTGGQIAAFRTYLKEILRWSARINLTALREPEEIVRAGFLDSLACLPLIPPDTRCVVDVGSGAGFPGVPLKLVRPDLALTLVEASRKKATFLRHIVRRIGLAEVRVIQRRAEELVRQPGEAGAYDLALARAVAAPPEQARLVRPFLRQGGLFLLQTGSLPAAPQAPDQPLGAGFELVRESAFPPRLGRPGRRVLAFRRVG